MAFEIEQTRPEWLLLQYLAKSQSTEILPCRLILPQQQSKRGPGFGSPFSFRSALSALLRRCLPKQLNNGPVIGVQTLIILQG